MGNEGARQIAGPFRLEWQDVKFTLCIAQWDYCITHS